MGELVLTRRGHCTRNRQTKISAATASNNNKLKPHPSEKVLALWIELAKYEANIDPYRGLQLVSFFSSVEKDEVEECPWLATCNWECSYNNKSNINIMENDDIDAEEENINPNEEESKGKKECDDPIIDQVNKVFFCKCPSIISWTQDAQKEADRKSSKSSRKKKIDSQQDTIGSRPTDSSFRCACDYNPLCLWSLGGVVSDIIIEATRHSLGKKKQQQALVVEAGDHSEALSSSCETQQQQILEPLTKVVIDLHAMVHNESRSAATDFSISTKLTTPLSSQLEPCYKNGFTYSKEVAHELETKRKSDTVEIQPIRSYLMNALRASHEKSKNKILIDELLQTYRIFQESLVFINPLLVSQKQRMIGGSANNNERTSDDNKKQQNNNNHMVLSIPPGILNLGATCYLNTQLQCLAQIPIFLEGIFHWRRPTITDNPNHCVMDSVLSKLQLLLANMVQGASNTIDTIEFSTALGLQHNEQQDPNEFARLLFERMHESFQETTNITTTEGNNAFSTNDRNGSLSSFQQQDLSTLLPRIFEGDIIYQTTCFTCKNVSRRSETFMDLNLPLVRPDRNGFISKLVNSFWDGLSSNKKADTDLQFCVDNYSSEEILNGDNQYYCSKCNCKRDAKRETVLGKLPPVLNIQLSRYVFDRKKLMKKKLTDKVLLPQVLYFATKENDGGFYDGITAVENHGIVASRKKYQLCAVMKHQGTSAYRGHYVAEAMDWMSGKWFEFNDEKVTLLKKGPSCSYSPKIETKAENNIENNVDESSCTKSRKKILGSIKGSEDAYNMYYVESSFLATSILNNHEIQNKLIPNDVSPPTLEGKDDQQDDVLLNVRKRRDLRYQKLTEMCVADGKASDRLQKRKDRIRKEMFVYYRNALLQQNDDTGVKAIIGGNTSAVAKSTTTDTSACSKFVWVDGNELRKFLSATDRMEDLFSIPFGSPLLRHKHLLCKHKIPGLHPRIARRGKLLPRYMYDAYISILRAEHASFLNISGDNASSIINNIEDVNDCVITPEQNLFCDQCSASYCKELRDKLSILTTLKRLYEDLDPKKDTFSIESETFENDADRYAYVVSRKSITSFRGQITSLLKSVASANSNATLLQANLDPMQSLFESNAEGLDAIDISQFDFSKRKVEENNENFDYQLNTNITCRHGNCNVAINRRQIRFVSWKVWESLKKIFPQAIEHRKIRSNQNNESDFDSDDSCPMCKEGERKRFELEDNLKNWGLQSLSRDDAVLLSLCGKKTKDRLKEDPLYEIIINENGNESSAMHYQFVQKRLVQKKLIAAWRDAISLVTGKTKKKRQFLSLPCQVKDIICKSSFLPENNEANKGRFVEEMSLDVAAGKSKILSHAVNELMCEKHKLTIQSAVFRDELEKTTEYISFRRLCERVTLLSHSEYDAFASSLNDLIKILFPSDLTNKVQNIEDRLEESKNVYIDLTQNEEEINKAIDDDPKHPSILIASTSDESELGAMKIHELNPRICRDKMCNEKYMQFVKQQFSEENSVAEGTPRGNGKVTTFATETESIAPHLSVPKTFGAVADDPILVESDTEDMKASTDVFNLRVFEAAAGYSIEDVLCTHSELLSQTPHLSTSLTNDNCILRRSTRKRKQRYPMGKIVREDSIRINLHYNVAALRLFLYEQCECQIDQNLTMIFLPPAQNENKNSPKVMESQKYVEENEGIDESKFEPILIDLPFESNHRIFNDLFESKLKELKLSHFEIRNPSASFLLLRQSEKNDAYSKDANTTLLDSLLEMSNSLQPISTVSKDCNETNRRVERGFQGTLLQSNSKKCFRKVDKLDPQNDSITKQLYTRIEYKENNLLDSNTDTFDCINSTITKNRTEKEELKEEDILLTDSRIFKKHVVKSPGTIIKDLHRNENICDLSTEQRVSPSGFIKKSSYQVESSNKRRRVKGNVPSIPDRPKNKAEVHSDITRQPESALTIEPSTPISTGDRRKRRNVNIPSRVESRYNVAATTTITNSHDSSKDRISSKYITDPKEIANLVMKELELDSGKEEEVLKAAKCALIESPACINKEKLVNLTCCKFFG